MNNMALLVGKSTTFFCCHPSPPPATSRLLQLYSQIRKYVGTKTIFGELTTTLLVSAPTSVKTTQLWREGRGHGCWLGCHEQEAELREGHAQCHALCEHQKDAAPKRGTLDKASAELLILKHQPCYSEHFLKYGFFILS